MNMQKSWRHEAMALPNRNSKGCSVMHFRVLAAVILLALSASACVVVSHRVDVQPVDRRDGVVIETPVKVHLTDGSTGVYAEGVTISAGTLRGKGDFCDIALKPFSTNPVLTPVSLDSVAAIETFQERLDRGKTVALLPVSILGSVFVVGLGAGSGIVEEAGTTLDKFLPAQIWGGVKVRIRTDQRMLMGELIAVRNDGIIVLDQKLRLLPYSTIVELDFEQQVTSRHAIRWSDLPLKKRRAPKPDALAHLRLLSRFPQGLSPSLLQQLLRVHGQTALASAP